MLPSLPPVTFWRVQDNKQKIFSVCQLLLHHFRKSQRQIVYMPNSKAAEYLDALLWSYPKDCLLPHAIASTPIQAALVITTEQKNLNQAQVLVNLTSALPALEGPLEQVHDLFDKTTPEKEQYSASRQKKYQKLGCVVAVQTVNGVF